MGPLNREVGGDTEKTVPCRQPLQSNLKAKVSGVLIYEHGQQWELLQQKQSAAGDSEGTCEILSA